jgi:hypothetical protein
MFQYYKTGMLDSFGGADNLFSTTLGVNARVVPAVALKFSISYAHFRDAQKGSYATDPLVIAASQIAWAF